MGSASMKKSLLGQGDPLRCRCLVGVCLRTDEMKGARHFLASSSIRAGVVLACVCVSQRFRGAWVLCFKVSGFVAVGAA